MKDSDCPNLVYVFFNQKANSDLINLLNELSPAYNFDIYIHKVGDPGCNKMYSNKLFIFHGESDEDFENIEKECGKFGNYLKDHRILICSTTADITLKWQTKSGAELALNISNVDKARGDLMSRMEMSFISQQTKQNISGQTGKFKTHMGVNKEKYEQPKKSFEVFKPLISRLFTYVVLFYIAYINWGTYLSLKGTYEDFVKLLKDPLIVDIKFIDHSSTCPENYLPLQGTTLKTENEGCICDNDIFRIKECQSFKKTQEPMPVCLDSNGELNPENNDSDGEFDFTCSRCYQILGNTRLEINITKFYSDKQVCVLYDTDQTTETYFRSAKEECEEKNICNDYFCKLNNDQTRKCPITQIVKYGYELTDPFGFSEDYRKYDNYDMNYNGEIFLPITGIYIGRQGMCDRDKSRYFPTYHLAEMEDCRVSELYHTFDKKNVEEILKFNSDITQIYSTLPQFKEHILGENWNIQSKTSFMRNSIHCLIKSKQGEFLRTMQSANKGLNPKREELKENFVEMIYVINNLSFYGSFQQFVQLMAVYISVIVTILEFISIIIRLFYILTGWLRKLASIISYEGYLVILTDLFLLVCSGLTYRVLHAFAMRTEELLEFDCFDEYSYSKMSLFKVALTIVADKSIEIFFILLCKITLLIIPLVYTIWTKKGRIKIAELEQIVLNKHKKLEKVIDQVKVETSKRPSSVAKEFRKKIELRKQMRLNRQGNRKRIESEKKTSDIKSSKVFSEIAQSAYEDPNSSRVLKDL